jgi:hypothetical protein
MLIFAPVALKNLRTGRVTSRKAQSSGRRQNRTLTLRRNRQQTPNFKGKAGKKNVACNGVALEEAREYFSGKC